MIDAKLRPWLLEVNVAPSLSSSSPYDKQVKTLLLCDTLHLVGFNIFDRNKVDEEKKKVDKQRLLGFDVSKTNEKNIPSFLDGFQNLSEDDLEIIAEFEEE